MPWPKRRRSSYLERAVSLFNKGLVKRERTILLSLTRDDNQDTLRLFQIFVVLFVREFYLLLWECLGLKESAAYTLSSVSL